MYQNLLLPARRGVKVYEHTECTQVSETRRKWTHVRLQVSNPKKKCKGMANTLNVHKSQKHTGNVQVCTRVSNAGLQCRLSELVHVYIPSRTLRSSSGTRMLEIQQYNRKSHGFRTFSCFGSHIWNSLPQDLRHCSTCHLLKPHWKPSSSHSISILTNISTQFLLQSVCVCVCVRACL